MILHDGDCREFEVDHVPGGEVNPPAWSTIRKRETVEIPLDHPLTGWRYICIVSFKEHIVMFGEYIENDGPFPGLMHASRARCVYDPFAIGVKDTIPPWRHEPYSPDADCQCGYRVVHDVTDLNMLIRQQAADQPLSRVLPIEEFPQAAWDQVGARPGDMCRADVGLVSVVGAGRVATCDFKTYRDPANTLRAEVIAGTPTVIVPESAPVGVFERFGMQPAPVSDITWVHEPSRCGDLVKRLELWRMEFVPDELEPDEVALVESRSVERDAGFNQHGRWGVHGAAGVALVRDGRVLLVRQHGGHGWQLPGGARHSDETPGQAATREALEETGLNVSGAEVRGAFAFSDVSGWTYTTIVADCPEGDPVPCGEVDEVGWFGSPPEGCHPDLVDSWSRLAPHL